MTDAPFGRPALGSPVCRDCGRVFALSRAGHGCGMCSPLRCRQCANVLSVRRHLDLVAVSALKKGAS
jgi:hypothetical protein